MNASVFVTHQPVLNKQQVVTANRLLVHASGTGMGQAAAQTLKDLSDVWPSERTIFLSLAGAMPDPRLLEWQAPPNVMFEIPAAALNSTPTIQLLKDLQQAGATLCLDGYVPVQTLPQSVNFRFVIADLADARCAAPPGLMLARDLADVNAFDTALKNGFDGAIGWFFLRTKPIAK